MQRQIITLVLGLGLLSPTYALAQFSIDNPPSTFVATLSGGTFIGGWHCDAETSLIVIRFTKDGESIDLVAGTGTSRGDTADACDDETNGFGISWNWNIFGDGPVSVEFFINGDLFATATVNVLTPGTQFLAGASGSCTIADFPASGQVSTVSWQEFAQGFQLTDVQTLAPDGEPVVEGAWLLRFLSFVADDCNWNDGPVDFTPPQADLLDIVQSGATLNGNAPFPNLDFSGSVNADGTFSLTTQEFAGDASDLPAGCSRTDSFTFAGNFLTEEASIDQDISLSGAACGSFNSCTWMFNGDIKPLSSALAEAQVFTNAGTAITKAQSIP